MDLRQTLLIIDKNKLFLIALKILFNIHDTTKLSNFQYLKRNRNLHYLNI